MLSRRSLLYVSATALAAPAVVQAKAPMLGVAPASMHRFKLGTFELTALRDGQITLDRPWKVFGENQKPEHVQAFAAKNNLPTDKHAITFTPLLVNTGKELLLFDTGWGRGHPGRGALAGSLAPAGYRLEDVDVVVLTHFHPDHIGGLMDGDMPVYPKARYVLGEVEYDYWTNPARAAGATREVYDFTKAKVTPLVAKASFVKDGGSVISGITALDTSGHTPGHLSYLLESSGQKLMITGDVCNHYVLSMTKPRWHVSFDMDKEKAVATRIRVLDMLAADRIPMFGYHMPFPAVGYVERHFRDGGHYHWQSAGYQFTM